MGRQNKGRSALHVRLLDFFKANPDEELTRADIMTKFSACESGVAKALAEVRSEVESVHVIRLRTKGMGRSE